MNNYATIAVSALALIVAAVPSSANAADVYSSAKDPVVYANTGPANWTGFYVGVNGGYGQNFDNLDTTLVLSAPPALDTLGIPVKGPDVAGFWFGGQAGYFWQMNGLVLGAELDFDGTNMTGDALGTPSHIFVNGIQEPITPGTVTTNMHQQLDWVVAPTVILGYAFGSIMPYVKGGAAFGHVQESVGLNIESSNLVTASREATDTGWTAGAGLGYKSGPFIFRIEWDYYDFGDHNVNKTFNLGEESLLAVAKNHETYDVIKASMSYSFGGGSAYIPLK